jgi:hypothetical protein
MRIQYDCKSTATELRANKCPSRFRRKVQNWAQLDIQNAENPAYKTMKENLDTIATDTIVPSN